MSAIKKEKMKELIIHSIAKDNKSFIKVLKNIIFKLEHNMLKPGTKEEWVRRDYGARIVSFTKTDVTETEVKCSMEDSLALADTLKLKLADTFNGKR